MMTQYPAHSNAVIGVPPSLVLRRVGATDPADVTLGSKDFVPLLKCDAVIPHQRLASQRNLVNPLIFAALFSHLLKVGRPVFSHVQKTLIAVPKVILLGKFRIVLLLGFSRAARLAIRPCPVLRMPVKLSYWLEFSTGVALSRVHGGHIQCLKS